MLSLDQLQTATALQIKPSQPWASGPLDTILALCPTRTPGQSHRKDCFDFMKALSSWAQGQIIGGLPTSVHNDEEPIIQSLADAQEHLLNEQDQARLLATILKIRNTGKLSVTEIKNLNILTNS